MVGVKFYFNKTNGEEKSVVLRKEHVTVSRLAQIFKVILFTE